MQYALVQMRCMLWLKYFNVWYTLIGHFIIYRCTPACWCKYIMSQSCGCNSIKKSIKMQSKSSVVVQADFIGFSQSLESTENKTSSSICKRHLVKEEGQWRLVRLLTVDCWIPMRKHGNSTATQVTTYCNIAMQKSIVEQHYIEHWNRWAVAAEGNVKTPATLASKNFSVSYKVVWYTASVAGVFHSAFPHSWQ